MKLDFISSRKLSWVAAGVAAVGLTQSIVAGSKRKKAERQLEKLETPTTTSDAGISGYYNSAMNRASNPYANPLYLMQKQNIGRNQATGLSALQDRRSGLAGIGGLIRGSNDASLRAAATADSQAQDQYGRAVQLKATDNERVFNINKMLPYQKKYSLLGAKAGGQAQVQNAGMSNMFGGLSLFGQQGGFKMFGNNNSLSGGTTGGMTGASGG